ncbi:MAG: hypothetical protein D3909_19360, partial [Candidatus Electrothrix sp. ATG1]|nr:hypothetical protein [Candidatus Electrothrix sp. ATG1]
AGTRGTVFQDKDNTEGMDNRVVRFLEDRYLLRAESRFGAIWYEMVHDRFIEPIQQANCAWLTAQDSLLRDAVAWEKSGRKDAALLYTGEKLKKALAELGSESLPDAEVREFLAASEAQQASIKEKEAARQALERRKQQSVIVLSLGLVITVALLIFAGWQWRKAEIAKQQAEDTQQVVKQQKDIVMQLFTKVNNEMIPALKKIPGTQEITEEVLQENFHIFHQFYTLSEDMGEESQQEKALSIIMLGDSYHGIGCKGNALALYNQALELQEALVAQAPDNTQAQRTLEEISSKIEQAGNLEHIKKSEYPGYSFGRREKILTQYQQSLKIWKLLANDNPDSRGAKWNLAAGYNPP